MIQQQSIQQQVEAQPKRALGSFAKILVATDFSRTSDRALEHALSLARTYSSRIFLAHLLPVDLMMAPEPAAVFSDQMLQAARAEVDRLESSGRFFGVSHEAIIEEGSLWPNLENLIRRLGIDLVVVGTHGKGAVQKVLIGSSAEEVFRNAQVPVLTVGGLGGKLETGRALNYFESGDENRKLCSLYLGIMDRMGVPLTEFGDAKTRLAGL